MRDATRYVPDGPKIKRLRHGHTQEQLIEAIKAAVAGGQRATLHVSTLSNAETTDEPVAARTLQMIALGLTRLTGVPVSWEELSVGRVKSNQRDSFDEADMYSAMARALGSLERDSIIRVCSFQGRDPRDPKNKEMAAYHEQLDLVLRREPGIKLYRLVSLQTPEKLSFLARMLRDYGEPARSNISVRVYPCADDFARRGIVLPPTVQLIGNRLFLGNPTREGMGSPCLRGSKREVPFWREYLESVWEKAGASMEVLSGGHIQSDNLQRTVFERVAAYARFVVANTGPGPALTTAEEVLEKLWGVMQLFPDLWYRPAAHRPGRMADGGRPYGRTLLAESRDFEVVVAHWNGQDGCLPHDHGGSRGVVRVLEGAALVQNYVAPEANHGSVPLTPLGPPRSLRCGESIAVTPDVVHSMKPVQAGLVTLHIYAGPVRGMRVFDLERRKGIRVGDCGAWWPTREEERLTNAAEFTF